MARNVAEQLVDALEKQGVSRVFGLVGDSLNPIVDAIRQSSIEWVHCYNEESAAFAAGAHSLITGELSVCAGSCGPGNTHMIQGLYDAHRNGGKVLALASQIPSKEIGSGFFQETHPEKLFEECSGYCELVNSAAQAGRCIHGAIQSTLAGHGVSVVSFPGDISMQEAVETPSLEGNFSVQNGEVHPSRKQLRDLADAINKADKVTMFGGIGCAGARDELFAVAEKIKSPVGHSYAGKEVLHYDNPYDVGMSGLLGYGACTAAFDNADLLILVGTDFPYTDFLPTTPTAQIDINGAHIGRRTHVEYPVVGDVKSTMAELLPLLKEKTDRSFLDSMLKKQQRNLKHVISAYTKNVSKHTPIHPEFLAYNLDDLADDDAIFTADTGMCNVWHARYIMAGPNRRLLASYRHGTMANALPQAIGAQAADRKRQVISMSGDGGLSMLMGELLTVKLHQLPIKMVVFNNSTLGMVKLEMMVQGIPDFGTDHAKFNYADIARAVGIKSYRVEDPKDVRSTLQEALAHSGPVLIDVQTDPNALSIPPDISLEQVSGFTKAAVRTVLDGGVGKMINIANSNLRNIPRPSGFKGIG